MENKKPFNEETVAAVRELGEIYRQIHLRLISEGYIIRDGVIYPPAEKDQE